MKMFILGFFVCYCIACIITIIEKDWIVQWLIEPFCAIAYVILFIPCTLLKLYYKKKNSKTS